MKTIFVNVQIVQIYFVFLYQDLHLEKMVIPRHKLRYIYFIESFIKFY